MERVNDPGGPQVPVHAATYGYRETILQNYIIVLYTKHVILKNSFCSVVFSRLVRVRILL